MPLNKSPSKEAFSENVADMINAGHPRDQALADAYHNAREHGAKFAFGGPTQGQPSMFNGWQRPQGMPQGFGMQWPTMPQGQGWFGGGTGMPQGGFGGFGGGFWGGMRPPMTPPQQPQQMPQSFPATQPSTAMPQQGGFGFDQNPLAPPSTSQGLSAAPPPSATNQMAVNPGTMPATSQPAGFGFAPPASPTTPAAPQSSPSVGTAPSMVAPQSSPSNSFAPPSHFAKGGLLPAAPVGPSAAPAPKGLIASPIAGRTDRLPMNVPPNSYVIPADVVSGLGQGNTMAGGRILDAMFGLPAPSSAPPNGAQPPANGHVPIITAGGEWIASPDIVARIGGGDPKKGHRILDKMVTTIRAQVIKQMKALPGPKK